MKITLAQFTRNMMQQLEGTDHVDIVDRSRRADRLEFAPAGFREASSGSDVHMGPREERRVAEVIDRIEAERKFFARTAFTNATGGKPVCNCKSICRGANPGVVCRQGRVS